MGHYRKKIIELFSLLLSLSGLSLTAQPDDRWKAGSAGELRDTIQTVYCFVETENNPWSFSEKASMLASLHESQQWLISQANRWKTPLYFHTDELVEGKNILFDSISSGTGSGKERVDWIGNVVKKAGYRNARHAYRKMSKKYHNKNIYVVLFARADGISYAMRYAKGMSKKKYFLEGLLVYQRYDNGARMPVTSIIAHEILHIYGAWDLYTTYAQTREKQTKATELYPDDIMLRVGYDMETITVDRLTAWLLGWNTQEEEIFEWFRPGDYSK